MKSIYLKILSWLLFQANKAGSNKYYFNIKNRILKQYGRHTGYVVQYIPGKKCRSCGGTGVYRMLDRYGFEVDGTWCWHCDNGWYKRPVWNILSQVEFGAYGFLQPYKRSNEKPDGCLLQFEGYVEHKPTKYSVFALQVLFICFEKGYLKRLWRGLGYGWYHNWKKPSNAVQNIIHLLKHGKNSIPIHSLRRKLERYRIQRLMNRPGYSAPLPSDDLPF